MKGIKKGVHQSYVILLYGPIRLSNLGRARWLKHTRSSSSSQTLTNTRRSAFEQGYGSVS